MEQSHKRYTKNRNRVINEQTHIYRYTIKESIQFENLHVKISKAITYQITRSTYSILHLHHSRAYIFLSNNGTTIPNIPNIFKQSIGPLEYSPL